MSEVDGATLMARSLKQQGIDHLFGVVGFPISRDRRSRAEGRRRLHRHAQRAERRLRGGGLRLSDRPSRRLRHRDRPRRGARPRGSRQRPAELLADDPDRRRLGDLSRRHGRVPGGAPGADRLAVLQVRARHRERGSASPTTSRWRPGTRSTAARAPAYLDMPDDIIQGNCDLDKAAQVERVPEPPRMVAPHGKRRGGAGPAREGPAAARPRRQGHGVVARRGRGARLHRAHAGAVRALADGQGRDAGRPSAVGRRRRARWRCSRPTSSS